MLREKIHDIGVGVHTSKTTQSIARCDDGLVLNFADGESLATDMVVSFRRYSSAGYAGAAALADGGERGGIVIDNQRRTSDPQVLAIGECALWQNKIYGRWRRAIRWRERRRQCWLEKRRVSAAPIASN